MRARRRRWRASNDAAGARGGRERILLMFRNEWSERFSKDWRLTVGTSVGGAMKGEGRSSSSSSNGFDLFLGLLVFEVSGAPFRDKIFLQLSGELHSLAWGSYSLAYTPRRKTGQSLEAALSSTTNNQLKRLRTRRTPIGDEDGHSSRSGRLLCLLVYKVVNFISSQPWMVNTCTCFSACLRA